MQSTYGIKKRISVTVAFVFMVLLCIVLPVHAEKETGTAGASLGKDTEIETGKEKTYGRARVGWVQTADGRWWYQDSDGGRPKTSWRQIDGKWYYFDAQGYWVSDNSYEKGSIKGIDISAWQEEINWQAVKDDGIQFAFIRLGHGEHELDKYYKQNMENANAAGIPVGVYFYSTARNETEAISDAQYVIKNLQGYLVSYPVVIDLEDNSQISLSKAQMGRIAKAYCDEVRAAGYTPMLYCNENWYKNHIDINQVADVEKWVARYNFKYDNSIPRGIWQACSTGRVNGIRGNVDIDFGYKDYTQIVTPRTSYADGYQMTGGNWVKDSRGWWFSYYAGGYPAQRWEYIGGSWYWFDSDGYMATGWRIIDGSWYYLSGSGAMATGWIKLGNTWYYLEADGKMAVGFKTIGSATYYLTESGAMACGWALLDGSWYYFDGSGAMATSWVKLGDTWYYLETDGKMAVGFKKVGNATYYLTESGAMATGWVLLDGTWYYFDGSGAMATNWIKLGDTWYYLETDGKMAVGFRTIGNVTYYLSGSGAMASGWALLDENWYYFDGSGAMASGWLNLGNARYYLAADGKMFTGWQTIDGSKYYFDGSGAMAVGKVQIDGVEYDFGSDGICRSEEATSL